MDEPTLGEDFDAGLMTERVAASYARWFGRDWRARTVQEAIDAEPAMRAAEEQYQAANAERVRIAEAFRDRGTGTGRPPPSDAVVAEVIRDLYGDDPPPGAMDAVLEVVENLRRFHRGEPFEPADR